MARKPVATKKSNECFYVDESGKRDDIDIHEELLSFGAEEEDSANFLRQAVSDGMDPDLAQSLYG